ncbi:hypothetical protein [Nocardioides sp. SR21]|uniref:hypothetical protein n=1 Tax=Nocardioides sp. SR21 TaxID=2919501 RepID=UPI001FA99D1C|nr:hypothetical protein [Nocardioides sp. SR21]
MRNSTGLAGAALLVAMLTGALAPASAETVRRDDSRNDAPARIDVSRATYTHAQEQVRVVARIPNLGRGGTAALSISRFEIFEAGFVVEIKKRAGKPPRTRLFFFNHFDLEPRRCDAVTGTWGRRRVSLSVDRACLDGHARERVFTQFGIQSGAHVDRAPAVKRLRRS